jgi:ABC-2 type transport system permease protein
MMQEIKEGTLSLRLLRPMHPVVSYSAESLAAIPMRLVVSVPIFFIAFFAVGGSGLTRDPALLGMFLWSLLGAWMLNFSVSAIVGVLGLFMESATAVWELWLGGFMLFSGYLLPLELFPPWLERFARALPFAYLQAVPVEILTGLHDRAGALRLLGYQLIYALCAMMLLLWLWRRGIRRFQAFGG